MIGLVRAAASRPAHRSDRARLAQRDGSVIRDAHPNGLLTVQQVIQKSSNVGTVKISQQMSAHELWEVFSGIGLGQKPQLPFPGVVSGRLRPYKTWRPIEQATMSYGYGLSASLFQLAHAYTVFARDGELVPVSLVKNPEPIGGVRVFSPHTAREVRKMLQMAAGPGGTGPLAQTVGYSVGGKSGTARKQEGRGYADKKYRSWFVGLAPIDQPRIVVAVMVDEPSDGKYFGGDVAAPVFKWCSGRCVMGVQPDLRNQPRYGAPGCPGGGEFLMGSPVGLARAPRLAGFALRVRGFRRKPRAGAGDFVA